MVPMFGINKRLDIIIGLLKRDMVETYNEDELTSKEFDPDAELDLMAQQIMKCNDPRELARLNTVYSEKTKLKNKLVARHRMTESNPQQPEKPSKEQELAQLAQKTDWIKGIWETVPGPIKSWCNIEAKKHTGGKTVDELLENSDALQNVLEKAGTVVTNLPKSKAGGKLDIETPYNPNQPPQA